MHPLPTTAGSGGQQPTPKETITLEIQKIRRDGGTQGRVTLNQSVVEEYAELMKAGTEFPPVRVWFDGDNYWLSDGFHRVAAAEQIGVTGISTVVCSGDLEDATWDCLSANACHGLRRSKPDLELIVKRALAHAQAVRLSNRELSRHLNIPEATLRRWVKSSSTSDNPDYRTAMRAGKAYLIKTANIRKSAEKSESRSHSIANLRGEFSNLKQLATPNARRLLVILGNWIFDRAPATVCLDLIEEEVRELQCSSHSRSVPKS